MKHIKLYEDFDFSGGYSEKLRNYIETKGLDARGFKYGRMFQPQNVDCRAFSYPTESGWVTSDERSKESGVSYFSVSSDGRTLSCYDWGHVFSGGDKYDLLETFNSKFGTSCEDINMVDVY